MLVAYLILIKYLNDNGNRILFNNIKNLILDDINPGNNDEDDNDDEHVSVNESKESGTEYTLDKASAEADTQDSSRDSHR